MTYIIPGYINISLKDTQYHLLNEYTKAEVSIEEKYYNELKKLYQEGGAII